MAVDKAIPSVQAIIAASLLISTVVSPYSAFAGKKDSPPERIPVNEMSQRIEAAQRARAQAQSARSGQTQPAPSAQSQGDDSDAAASKPAESSAGDQSGASKSAQSNSVVDDPTSKTESAETKSKDSSNVEAASSETPSDSSTDADREKSASAASEAKVLKGAVTHSIGKSPLMYDKPQEVSKGTSVNLVSLVNINSEVNQKGDEIWMRVGNDVHGPSEVAVPGGWYMHGVVTEAMSAKRLGRDGYVTVQFDKLVSPDKQFEVPFDAHVSSKQSTAKALAKNAAITSVHMGYGALGGSILSVQFTGIGGAIATHGISVGVGAGIGATIGLIGAAKRKGDISQITPGDDMKMVFAQPITLPGFDSKLIPSAKPPAKLENFDVQIKSVAFGKDPNGDKKSARLAVEVVVNNHTKNEYGFAQMAVVSDRGEYYYPNPFANNVNSLFKNRVKPDSSGSAIVVYDVAGKQHKYWLVLMDHATNEELNRVPIN
ncbi:MAG TPA: DUF4352 domain-containing protein [Drouetiella sp.]